MPYSEIVIFNVWFRFVILVFFVIRITVCLLLHCFLVVDLDDAFQKQIVLSYYFMRIRSILRKIMAHDR
nr:MAG TPA: hypothetical protein [Myoviridae sp. ctfuG5]